MKIAHDAGFIQWSAYVGLPLIEIGSSSEHNEVGLVHREVSFDITYPSHKVMGTFLIEEGDIPILEDEDLFRAHYAPNGDLNGVRLYEDSVLLAYRWLELCGSVGNFGLIQLQNLTEDPDNLFRIAASYRSQMLSREIHTFPEPGSEETLSDLPKMFLDGKTPVFHAGAITPGGDLVVSSPENWICRLEIPGQMLADAVISPRVLLKSDARFSTHFLKTNSVFYRLHPQGQPPNPWQRGKAFKS